MNYESRFRRLDPISSEEMRVQKRTADVARVINCLQQAVIYGNYDRQLKMPQINDLKQKLNGEELSRFEKMMELYQKANGQADLQLVASNINESIYPGDLVGELTQTLYILTIGASADKELETRKPIRVAFLGQCAVLAADLGKESSRLTIDDLGWGILTGSFNPKPDLP